jgi:hypothetical protein
MADTADKLLENRLMRSHDLTGAVFQRLIDIKPTVNRPVAWRQPFWPTLLFFTRTSPAAQEIWRPFALSTNFAPPPAVSPSQSFSRNGVKFSKSVPPDIIDAAADQLVSGVSEAAGLIEEMAKAHLGAIHKISEALLLTGSFLQPTTLRRPQRRCWLA